MSTSTVVYYTWSPQAHTRSMARIIAGIARSDLLELTPATPYPQDFDRTVKQAKNEVFSAYHPPLTRSIIDLQPYEVVFVGSPIWWWTIAPPLVTFLGDNDLSGRIVMPFSTHGGGGKGNADRDITALCPEAKVMPMHRVLEGGGATVRIAIEQWISDCAITL